MSQPRHDADLTPVERALAGLAPSAGAFNRDALMFAAGRASAPRGWGWPCAAAGSALAAAVLAALLFFRPAPETVVRYVPVPAVPQQTAPPSPADDSLASDTAPPAAPASPLPPEVDCLTLRRQMERWGDSGLPGAPPAADDRPPESRDLPDLPPDVRTDGWLQRRRAMLHPGGFQ
jgi:hypothetical protein